MQNEEKQLHKEYDRLLEERNQLRYERDAILASWSFRIGRILTWFPRKVRGIRRYMKNSKNMNYCPICNKRSEFKPFGIVSRQKAQCNYCNSLERHRLLWIFLKRKTAKDKGKNKKLLHIAAEPCLKNKLNVIFKDGYLTADLYDTRAMIKLDITNIDYPEETFDIIICNHVFEHVIDDIKAMNEFYRTLKTTGWAMFTVPIIRKITEEDYAINTPEGRLKAFGQKDHVRAYGPDFIDRLRSVGFTVKPIKANELMTNVKKTEMNIGNDTIFYCEKKER
ncbi:MAG: class I SAM-dependent methyltransferase [Treponema sp.]|nr:class I SAM-dependent methyltransferase [Treponema sp.]